jgi:DNA-directed RNA polymerase sigma subunit (sigma70/sigma32)
VNYTDLLADEGSTPEEIVLQTDIKDKIHILLGMLDKRSRFIIESRFGSGSQELDDWLG